MAELYRFLKELVDNGQLPAFLCGVILGCSIIPLLLKLLKRWFVLEIVRDLKGQISRLQVEVKNLSEKNKQALETIDSLQDDKDSLGREMVKIQDEKTAKDEQIVALGKDSERVSRDKDEKIGGLSKACEDAVTNLADIRLKLNKERKNRRVLQRTVNSYSKQLDDITNSDGKIWEDKANTQLVPFVPLSQRRTVIISLLNLKGGVGKTTLTANLGVALAAQGLRVLLIDLDHQSSLTNLFLNPDERRGAKESNRTIDHFFEEGGDFEKLRQCVTRGRASTETGQIHIAAVTEDFVDIENRLQARWVVGLLSEDVRYRLRKGLHSPWLREYYDVVLIDCPPRWSTASVNSIASSDYVLIPVLLEEMSIEAVPRVLNYLRIFQSACCPELNLLGVVGNKATNRANVIAREYATWVSIQDTSRNAWNAPVRFFEEIIREHSPVQGQFASLDPGHKVRYEKLIRLIREEIPHAYLQPPAIHPIVGAPAVGGRT